MSEEEKKKRAEYKRKRKIWMIVHAVVLCVVFVCTCAFFGTYKFMDKKYYVSYTESSEVDYKVYLKPNDYFDEPYLEKGQSYVASLIDAVEVDFSYQMKTDAKNMQYEYAYSVDLQLLITDESSENPILSPVYSIKPHQTASASGKTLTVREHFAIDYDAYNALANEFVTVYELHNTTSELVATMNIRVVSASDELSQNGEDEYTVALHIPLTEKTVNMQMRSSQPNREGLLLASAKGANAGAFKTAAIVCACLTVLLGAEFVLFTLLTRNKDINYAIKVQALVKSYRSYIQQLVHPFCFDGYQVLELSSFNEMLDVHDTVQSPILMHENDDKTRTQFVIPTQSNFLYLFEIKVDDYDLLYGNAQQDETEIAAAEDEIQIVEAPAQEPVPMAQEETESVDESMGETEESRFAKIKSKYDFSFEAKLALADKEVKDYYRLISTTILSYGVKIVRSWKRERVYLGRKLFAVMNFRGNTLSVALSLDPKAYVGSKYRFTDVSEVKKYQATPMLMKITSARKAKHTVELLKEMFKTNDMQIKADVVETPSIKTKSRKKLIEEKLIKVNE